jgi:hypothetical protein
MSANKRFYVQMNIGHAKYVVNHHDGCKKHRDGSDLFDIAIFKNKKKLASFISDLQNNGYKEVL